MPEVTLHRRKPAAGVRRHEFKPSEIDSEGGQLVAQEMGSGYEFWWVRCGSCLETFGAAMHVKDWSAACAHCASLQLITIEEREEVRTWRRQQAGLN